MVKRRAGRLFQKGDIEAFGSINKRCRGVGGISIVGGFGIGTTLAAALPLYVHTTWLSVLVYVDACRYSSFSRTPKVALQARRTCARLT